jgi:hypothetical protein
MAQVVTADIRASRMIQQQREFEAMGEDGAAKDVGVSSDVIKSFRGRNSCSILAFGIAV